MQERYSPKWFINSSEKDKIETLIGGHTFTARVLFSLCFGFYSHIGQNSNPLLLLFNWIDVNIKRVNCTKYPYLIESTKILKRFPKLTQTPIAIKSIR